MDKEKVSIIFIIMISVIIGFGMMFTMVSHVETEKMAKKKDAQSEFATICLDGVEYWYSYSINKGFLAARIDPNTMTLKKCEKSNEQNK